MKKSIIYLRFGDNGDDQFDKNIDKSLYSQSLVILIALYGINL